MNKHVGNKLKQMKISRLEIVQRKCFFGEYAASKIDGHIHQN